jgi:cytochrome c556
MKEWVIAAALFAGAGVSIAWAADAPAKSPQQIVDERVAGMKKMGGALKAASESMSNPAAAKAKLAGAIAFAETIPAHFPKGTGIGDPGVTKSRALQEIWAKPAEFKAAAEAVVAALKAVDTALDSGDQAAVGAAFKGVGKGCGGCHTPFRGPDTD